MKKAKIIVPVFLLVLMLGFIGSVCAITGSIGNARMILRADAGDTIEKSILVKNVNNVPVDVELFASGDLADGIDIIDNNFRLGVGEDKKAHFTIKVKKAGTTESKVNVQFAPIDEGNGVGLSSTIIVIAEKGPGFFEELFGEDEEPDVSIGEDPVNKQEDVSASSKVMKVSLSVTSIVLLLFVILLIIASQKKGSINVNVTNNVNSKKDVKIKSKKSRSKI